LTAYAGRGAQPGHPDKQPDLLGTQAERSSGRLIENKAGPKPRLIVLPLQPVESRDFNGTGLALHFLLGNMAALHDGLQEFWFGWRSKKIFPQAGALQAYCRRGGFRIDIRRLGRVHDVRYWLEGVYQEIGGRISLSLLLIDTRGESRRWRKTFVVKPEDRLLLFRQSFVDWLDACGLPFSAAQINKVFWPEACSRKGLDLLGRALETFYLHSYAAPDESLELQAFENAVFSAPDSYLAHDLKGWAHYYRKEFPAARASFLTALRINPDGVGAVSGLMGCAIHDENQEKTYYWAAVKARLRGERPERAKAGAAYRLGKKAYERKDFATAAELFKQAGTWNPFKSLYLIKLARAYRMSGEPGRALEVLGRGLESFQSKADRRDLFVEKADVLFGLARNLIERNRFREAVKRFEEAAAIDRYHRPERAIRAFKNIAAIYARIGEAETALEYRQRILELEKRKDENK
jgi:tetratricopeptide (TPR) repeat protein